MLRGASRRRRYRVRASRYRGPRRNLLARITRPNQDSPRGRNPKKSFPALRGYLHFLVPRILWSGPGGTALCIGLAPCERFERGPTDAGPGTTGGHEAHPETERELLLRIIIAYEVLVATELDGTGREGRRPRRDAGRRPRREEGARNAGGAVALGAARRRLPRCDLEGTRAPA